MTTPPDRFLRGVAGERRLQDEMSDGLGAGCLARELVFVSLQRAHIPRHAVLVGRWGSSFRL